MDEQGVIGANGALPWRLSSDLRHFKAITMGKPIIMGRKTHESIGRALPGRENIIITRQHPYRADGCTVFHDIDGALGYCADKEEVMIIGGADLYGQLLPRASRIYLTQVNARVRGDVFFPQCDPGDWKEIARKERKADENNAYACCFLVLEKRR